MLKILKIIFPVLLIHFQLVAQNPGELKGFYGSMNLGLGVVNGNIAHEEKNTDPHFAMHFNAGVFLNRSLQVGLTLNGWLFETYGQIPFGFKGESISNGMVHIQLYPVKNNRLFFKSAYGICEYKNLRPDKDEGRGKAFMIATGYEKEIGKSNFLTGIQVSYSMGKLKYTDISGTNGLPNRKFQTIDLTIFLAID